MTLAEAIRVVADELLETNARGAAPLQVAHAVELRYPELFADHATELARKHLLTMARLQLRPTAGDQDELPGFGGLPRTFTVQDGEGDIRYVALRFATLDDETADLEVKRGNVAACQAEYDKARQRHRRLWSAPGAHGLMLVVEAAEAVS